MHVNSQSLSIRIYYIRKLLSVYSYVYCKNVNFEFQTIFLNVIYKKILPTKEKYYILRELRLYMCVLCNIHDVFILINVTCVY